MITIDFDKTGPLYEQLYRHIRQSVVSGGLKAGEKLPSKRKLAEHLQISVSTVENAYAQLIAEGYIEPVEKRGYFVRHVAKIRVLIPEQAEAEIPPPAVRYDYDLKTNAVDTASFPFTVWTKLMRESLRDEHSGLLETIHPQGDPRLRTEIANYLRQFRNMNVDAEQIILGAGTEYLIGLITELLPGSVFALEDPCYHKPAKILDSRKVKYHAVKVDDEGIDVTGLSDSSVALITPSRHFPLGTVMSINRRMQILQWAAGNSGRYIIEDDYDSEYRYVLKQIPALHSLDESDSVIYLNTFARTLAPSLRIGYMVLPKRLLETYRNTLLFYSCTVSEFEQCTLWRFLRRGYYERHLSRMRHIYKSRRDIFLRALSELDGPFQIFGSEAGLHLLIRSETGVAEKELVQKAKNAGVKVYGLSGYFLGNPPETHTVIAGYGGLSDAALSEASRLLVGAWTGKADTSRGF